MYSRQITGPRAVSAHLVVLASSHPELAAVGYVDGIVILVDASCMTQVIEFDEDVAHLAMCRAGAHTILAAALPASVRIVPLGRAGAERMDLTGHDGRVTKVALFAGDGPVRAVSADERGNVHRWSLPSGTRTSICRAHRKSIHTLVPGWLSKRRPSFLTGSDDRKAIVHDLSDDDVRHVLEPHAGWIGQVAPADPHGMFDVIVTTDRIGLTIWDRIREIAIRRVPIEMPAHLACWSGSSGIHVAVSSEDAIHLIRCSPAAARLVEAPWAGSLQALALTGLDDTEPTLRIAINDRLARLAANGSWVTDTCFPQPILAMRPWASQPGAVVILTDGSIWQVRW